MKKIELPTVLVIAVFSALIALLVMSMLQPRMTTNAQQFTATPAVPSYYLSAFTTSTTIKSGSGSVHTVSVNSKASVAHTLTLYDNTAANGTILATIDVTNTPGTSYTYDMEFANGLTIAMPTGGGGTPADVTITYR